MKKEDISPIEKINELRLDASNPISKGKIFVLLEGDDDCRIFNRLLAAHCKVEWVSGGKGQLENALQTLLEAQLPCLIIGIRDADFLHLEGKRTALAELFLTDFHDFEMMMVYADEAFEAITAEFIGKNNLLFREKLLETLRFVSYLRWWNELNDGRLKFKATSFGDFFDANSLQIEIEKYLQKLLEKSANATETNAYVLQEQVQNLTNQAHDLFQLCNGHDFMEILKLYFNAKGTSKGVTEARIASQFRTAYTKTTFQQTQLYANLANWAANNQTTI